MKIRPVGVELFHADGQTDRHDESNSRFSQFFEHTPNNKLRLFCDFLFPYKQTTFELSTNSFYIKCIYPVFNARWIIWYSLSRQNNLEPESFKLDSSHELYPLRWPRVTMLTNMVVPPQCTLQNFQARHPRCVDRSTSVDKCSQTQLLIFVLLRGVST